jgi:elongator complex protein 6
MSSRHRAPLVLESYLQVPRESATLVVLTSTLGCTVNWLISHFIGVALQDANKPTQEDDTTANGQESCAVLLVSWLRDLAVWKQELKRAIVRRE